MPRQSQSATIQTRHPQDHKCCGIVEGARYQVEIRRENRTTPQPWIARKLLVFVTIGILAYAAYVYIGRFCIKFIEGTFNRRASGIALLIVFVILYFWTLWSYMKVILTSPGYAKNHVHSTSTPQPTFSRQGSQPLPLHRVQKESDDIQLREPSGDSRFSHKREHSLSTLAGTQPSPLDTVGGPSYEDILLRTTTDKTVPRSNEPQAPNPDVAVALPPPAVTPSPAQRKLRKIFHPPRSKVSQPRVYITRRPPMKAVLLPEHRYCDKETIVKPYRAHHCRHCGACVLKYDHHCPWIGQCVGARNHKFFVNFTQAAGILCVYVFSTILAFDLHDTVTHHTDFDPQHIVLIALAGLFSIFTWTLTVSHVMLITGSKTTIEHMIIRRMEEHESEQLDKAFAFWDFRGRKLMRKEWDREWGKLNTEGHIWWTDDKRRAWEDVMGQSVLGWFLPIGRGLNDGLSFPVNPRFDADGRWRRRTEWPPEYQ